MNNRDADMAETLELMAFDFMGEHKTVWGAPGECGKDFTHNELVDLLRKAFIAGVAVGKS